MLVALALGGILLVAAIAIFAPEGDSGPPYYTETSPDGRFEIVVVADHDEFALPGVATPGQGGASEGPGIVILKDALGRELARARVDMKQSVPGGVIWTPGQVSIVANGSMWALPAAPARKDRE